MKELTDKISRALKSLRKQKDWSLDIASKNTGVSKAMLGQIERGVSVPTIATLWKIAVGFEIPFSFFFEESKSLKDDPKIEPKDLRSLIDNEDKLHVLPVFTYDEKLRFETFIIELFPNCEHVAEPHHAGVIEHIIVIEGEIEILIQGMWRKLKKNEGVYFEAHHPHAYKNPSLEKAVFHNIIHYNVA